MDRVILYGVGETFRCFEKMFLDFQEHKKVQILGVADKNLLGGVIPFTPIRYFH